jgi:hypothetical protein
MGNEMSGSHSSVAEDSNCSTISDEAIHDSLCSGALSFTFKKFSINLTVLLNEGHLWTGFHTQCTSVLDCDLHPVGLQRHET